MSKIDVIELMARAIAEGKMTPGEMAREIEDVMNNALLSKFSIGEDEFELTATPNPAAGIGSTPVVLHVKLTLLKGQKSIDAMMEDVKSKTSKELLDEVLDHGKQDDGGSGWGIKL